MAITKDAGRQYPMTAYVDFTFADLTSGSGIAAIDIPPGATVTGGGLLISTAFDSGTSDTMSIGDSGVTTRYENAQDVKSAAGFWPLTLTGYKYTVPDTIDLLWTAVGTAATAGAGRLIVEYIMDNRANEVVPG